MAKACIHPGCLNVSTTGNPRCPTHAREHNRTANMRRRNTGHNAARRLRTAINRRGFGVCVHCQLTKRAGELEIDHRIPLERGGTDTPDNVQPLCKPCHRTKTQNERDL